jgi:hypothetical protein
MARLGLWRVVAHILTAPKTLRVWKQGFFFRQPPSPLTCPSLPPHSVQALVGGRHQFTNTNVTSNAGYYGVVSP